MGALFPADRLHSNSSSNARSPDNQGFYERFPTGHFARHGSLRELHSANVPTGAPKYTDNRRKWSRVKRRLP